MAGRVEEAVRPGHPGRGYDPTASFTDLQWYLFHQRNVAYFAAFSAADYDDERALATARGIVEHLPQLAAGYRGARPHAALADDVLLRLVRIETLTSLDGLPERWLNADGGLEVYADPALPFFRVRIGRLASGPDPRGRRAFLLVWVSHVFVEGTDSAELSRSRASIHAPIVPARETPPAIRMAARAFGVVAALIHLAVSRFITPHPGRIVAATRAVPRRRLMAMARRLGIRQRSLLMALVAAVIADGGTPTAKRRLSTTYSTIDAAGGGRRDRFMRMRMLFALIPNAPGFADFARATDRRLAAAEARETGFNAEMNAAAIAVHRRLSGLLPWLYGPKVFAFMPYDFVFGLIPPHRLAGPLSAGLMEPVYAGATQPGINGCVVVPGRELVTFNFFMEERLVPNMARLDDLLAEEAAATAAIESE